MASGCCTRRREDGHVDRVAVERAAAGHAAELSPTEARLAMWRMSLQRHVGLDEIARHFGYSRSHVASVLAKARNHR
jgi:AraC-like DNA-binding protein